MHATSNKRMSKLRINSWLNNAHSVKLMADKITPGFSNLGGWHLARSTDISDPGHQRCIRQVCIKSHVTATNSCTLSANTAVKIALLYVSRLSGSELISIAKEAGASRIRFACSPLPRVFEHDSSKRRFLSLGVHSSQILTRCWITCLVVLARIEGAMYYVSNRSFLGSWGACRRLVNDYQFLFVLSFWGWKQYVWHAFYSEFNILIYFRTFF